MLGMYSEVSHASVLTVYLDHSFPIDRLFQIHIARMAESGTHFDNLAELVILYPADKLLTAGKIRKLA